MSFVNDARSNVVPNASAARQLRHAHATAIYRGVHIEEIKCCVELFICRAASN
jgi:hypothetical protein